MFKKNFSVASHAYHRSGGVSLQTDWSALSVCVSLNKTLSRLTLKNLLP